MRVDLDLEIPDHLIDDEVRRELADLVREAREKIVLSLFDKRPRPNRPERTLPSAVAATLLGLDRMAFMDLCRKKGIPYIVYTEEDLAEDIKTLEGLRKADTGQ